MKNKIIKMLAVLSAVIIAIVPLFIFPVSADTIQDYWGEPINYDMLNFDEFWIYVATSNDKSTWIEVTDEDNGYYFDFVEKYNCLRLIQNPVLTDYYRILRIRFSLTYTIEETVNKVTDLEFDWVFSSNKQTLDYMEHYATRYPTASGSGYSSTYIPSDAGYIVPVLEFENDEAYYDTTYPAHGFHFDFGTGNAGMATQYFEFQHWYTETSSTTEFFIENLQFSINEQVYVDKYEKYDTANVDKYVNKETGILKDTEAGRNEAVTLFDSLGSLITDGSGGQLLRGLYAVTEIWDLFLSQGWLKNLISLSLILGMVAFVLGASTMILGSISKAPRTEYHQSLYIGKLYTGDNGHKRLKE